MNVVFLGCEEKTPNSSQEYRTESLVLQPASVTPWYIFVFNRINDCAAHYVTHTVYEFSREESYYEKYITAVIVCRSSTFLILNTLRKLGLRNLMWNGAFLGR
jgi:hypothetical protein